MASLALLEVSGLNSGYGKLQVLWNISMRLEANEIVAVIGPNGAGKTTLLKTIAGIIKPFAGHVIYQNQVINGIAPHKLVRKGLVYVPDGSGVFGNLTVLENLSVGAYWHRSDLRERLERVYDFFPVLGEKSRQPAATLSGGEKQMLVLGRALMAEPKVILLDEPSTGLSPIAVQNLYAMLEKLVSSTNLSVVLVEQDVSRAFRLASRAYLLEAGKVRMEGPVNELRMSEVVKKYFVGG